MADLEKNLEQAIEEAMQPDSKAEKGDSKPVKQGSSDAAKIESGKGEVVKPEENPVDKAVASIKSAEGGSKENSSDPQKKGAGKSEPQPKLKKVSEEEDSEEEKPSKMEMIKAMVNAMKGMDKESLQAMYKKVSDDEEEVELEMGELGREEEEEYVEEEMSDEDGSNEEIEVLDEEVEDSSQRQSSVVSKLTKCQKLN